MDIVEAISQRKSIRAFKPVPVPKKALKEIMDVALRAPSWGNTQPWEFAIVGGSKLEEIKQGYIQKADEKPTPDVFQPAVFPEPYDSRHHVVVAGFSATKGIRREDREKRGWWRLQGLRNFGAPVVIYIYIDRSLCLQTDSPNIWAMFDSGMVAENIMLLATRYGLGSIAQAQAVYYPDVLRKVLGIPDSKLIVLGISIGYPDWNDPITQFRSEREPLDKVAKWYGFD